MPFNCLFILLMIVKQKNKEEEEEKAVIIKFSKLYWSVLCQVCVCCLCASVKGISVVFFCSFQLSEYD